MEHRRVWHVDILTNAKTGLLMAISDDLKGLYVHARTERELEARIPDAIRSILEASGETVPEIVRMDKGDSEPKRTFSKPKRRIAYQAPIAA